MKRALITGATRGIGRAIAQGLTEDHQVLVGARDFATGQAVAAELGGEAVEIDLMRPETLQRAADMQVDVLINNAGILGSASLLAEDSDFDDALQVMVRGPLQLIRAVMPHMAAQGWGRIVNLSSGWGSFAEGLAGPGAYGVAKAALNALTHALPRDLPKGVTVNAMCPGWVHTDMGGAGAPRTPPEGAATALWLARQPDGGPNGQFFRDCKSIPW